MAFKVAARTLLHLGAELISSDAVALFELIKNAFDAGSTKGVEIQVVMRLPEWPGELRQRCLDLDSSDSDALEEVREALIQGVDSTAPTAALWCAKVRRTKTSTELVQAAKRANYIRITDTGHGMSLRDLEQVYLTLGTRFRLEEKKANAATAKTSPEQARRPILGEKGLGRLAVMRLGNRVRIESTTSNDVHWNILQIDWTWFSHDSDALIDSIVVEPTTGKEKIDKKATGTRILIDDLLEPWTDGKLRQFAITDAAKLRDPFTPRDRYPITLLFNNDPISIPVLQKLLFKHAHASVEAHLEISHNAKGKLNARLTGRVDYRLQEREMVIDLQLADIVSMTRLPPSRIESLGPFSMQAYWYNRQLLQAVEQDGVKIKELVKQWGGGLMLFRDGFRVYPYGDSDDDWLNLDRKALASQGYKVNRQQIVGKVDISGVHNPALLDQTNREGLRDCPEKQGLVLILKHVLEDQFREFLNAVDKEEKAKADLDFGTLQERVAREQNNVEANFRLLIQKHPEIKQEANLLRNVEGSIKALQEMMKQAEELADEFDEGRSQLVHLAGLGLMVEMLAHELNRATLHAMDALAAVKEVGTPEELPKAFNTLEFQLKSLQKRLSMLDPLTTSGRQRKNRFDIADLAREVIAGHEAEFSRHSIHASVQPKGIRLPVMMVRGMVIQILENILSNSAYWLKQQKRLEVGFKPQITIEIDRGQRTINITDNGPGVAVSIAERVFQPFVTTKPPGLGKGLGLYISREIARYHDVTLSLSPERRIHDDRFNTFVLTLPKE